MQDPRLLADLPEDAVVEEAGVFSTLVLWIRGSAR
jgi:hypothetical protein